ncbi:hypothetical protein T4E_3529, partial [Trichinella pseudospiralis]
LRQHSVELTKKRVAELTRRQGAGLTRKQGAELKRRQGAGLTRRQDVGLTRRQGAELKRRRVAELRKKLGVDSCLNWTLKLGDNLVKQWNGGRLVNWKKLVTWPAWSKFLNTKMT